MRFAIFPVHVSKVLRLPRKSEARSYEVLHLSRKIILENLKISCSKMQPLSGNLRPDLLTHLLHVTLVLRLPRDIHLSRSSDTATKPSRFANFSQGAESPAPATQNDIWTSKSAPYPSVLHFWLGNVLCATTAFTFSTSELPKVLRGWGAFYILTWKSASRHSGVHFFRPQLPKVFRVQGFNACFVHVGFEMCFTPQRRAFFQFLNFQKCFEPVSFQHFWLRNLLCATTACTFSTYHLPKVVREWCASDILTSKCASRHNGVQLFMFYLATWLCMRRFSEPTFRPSRATNHWKNTVFRDFSTFSHTCIFFLLILSLLWSSLFCSSLLCLFSPLLFPSVLIVGSLTSKLPSTIITTTTITTTTTATTSTTHNYSYNFSCNYKRSYNYNYKEATQHHATSTSYGWGDRCKHSKKHNSNHLSVHQWIRCAIHASQLLTSPILSYLWNFRHRLVWSYR